MRKTDFCLCENKGADQLPSNCEADQRLCFRYLDSTIPLLPKYDLSSFLSVSVTVQLGLCRTYSEFQKTGFLALRLNYLHSVCAQIKTSKLSDLIWVHIVRHSHDKITTIALWL